MRGIFCLKVRGIEGGAVCLYAAGNGMVCWHLKGGLKYNLHRKQQCIDNSNLALTVVDIYCYNSAQSVITTRNQPSAGMQPAAETLLESQVAMEGIIHFNNGMCS